MPLLGHDEAALQAAGGLSTAAEIVQQPETLRAIAAQLARDAAQISAFVAPLLARRDLRVILTGAGTSAFIGECLVPFLGSRLLSRLEAVATTDIVAGPRHYLDPATPTLLVSFGRSGNSPESVAALDLAEQSIGECHHLAITCNAEGALGRRIAALQRGHVITLPEATHDRGFAMTSSFTGMMYAALAALTGTLADTARAEAIAAAVAAMIDDGAAAMASLADQRFNRVVYLGSNGFRGLAREAALKLLELSDGDTVAMYETPLGFRHGPKTVVNSDTLIMMFVSNDPYTRRYDLDLLDELRRDGRARQIVALSAHAIDMPEAIRIRGLDAADDSDLLFPMIIAPQMLAFYQSLALGKTPDRPNATGIVNRVVEGVTIHALQPA